MRYLILGATGQVGWELMQRIPQNNDVVGISRDGHFGTALDLTDLSLLTTTLDDIHPDIIINAAAYTAVDRAEDEPELADTINHALPEKLGQWAEKHGKLVTHYSTDYVFDGSKQGAYIETDPPAPINTYGRSKLAGDQALLDTGCTALIFRVSWVYGMRGRNFLLTMQRLMSEREQLNIVNDQIGSPTWCGNIAAATLAAVGAMPPERDTRHALSGIYNLAPHGSTSWYGFAGAIKRELGLECELRPITSIEYPTPAARPLNSVMDCTKFVETFGVELPTWEQGFQQCLSGA